MAVIQTKIKSRSYLQNEEWDDSIVRMLESCTPEELEIFERTLNDSEFAVDFASEVSALEYQSDYPVPMEDFLSDPYYLGESCKGLFPVLRKDLIELFSSFQYQTVLLVGSLGFGKSEFASIALLRMIYEAGCLIDPAVTYGLSSGSKIGFCLLAPTEQVARAAAFEKIVTKIQHSEYFSEVFGPITNLRLDRMFKGNEIEFPKKLSIICGSSSESASLGANIMGGFVDELNFFKRDAKSVIVQNDRYGVYSKAGKLFDSLQRRIKSRFARKGKLPGILIGASSKTTKDALMERFIRESAQNGDPTVFVRDYSIVDVKPEAFSDKTFKILVGNEYYSSKILPDNYDTSELGSEAIIVIAPEDLRQDFERDLESSLRDLLGISTSAIHSFITKVEYLQYMKDETRSHPFICPLMADPQQWDSRLPYNIHWEKLATLKENGDWEPLLNPWAKRYVALDPAITNDAFGLTIGHIAGLVKVKKQNEDSEDFNEYLPYFVIDFVLRIQGTKTEEVLFRKVRQLIYEFSAHGFHLAKLTSDKFQSKDMLEQLKAQGYRAEVLSVDEEKEPYFILRRAIYDKRISCYYYPALWEELRTLEEGATKIDHNPNGGCFSGETRVPLLDGSFPMISELVNKEVWVYSCKSNGMIIPGKARGRLTKYVTDVIDVILDNGSVIRCTPEHLWMMRDGTYKEAKDLRIDIDRLMPINRYRPINGGYEAVGNKDGKNTLTHYMSYEYFNNTVVNSGSIIHHKDGDKLNNVPSNLEKISRNYHSRQHTNQRWGEERKKKLRDGHINYYKNNPEKRVEQAERMRRNTAKLTVEQRLEKARKNKNFRSDITIDRVLELRRDSNVATANTAAKLLGCGRNVIVRIMKDCGCKTWKEFLQYDGKNHKAKQIIKVKLNEPIPVYDLEVDIWNNFALVAGVFVHNSKDNADALCACIYSLHTEATYSEPVLPQKGITVSVDSNHEQMFVNNYDENFIKAESHEEKVLIASDVKKEVFKPQYRKITEKGQSVNLLKREEKISNYIIDFIEIG